jgi:predicted HicB family RNase H-like nuclease
MNQSAWIEQGRQLYRTHQNSQFQIGDWVRVGIQAFGRTAAFDAAQQITGTKNTRNFYTRCAAVASYYKPALRFPKLSFHTYEVLARFPLSFLERFIPGVADSGRSCKQIYSLAVERYGSDPRQKRKSGKFHNVRLPEKLFQSLAVRASSPDKTHLLIVQVLSEWEKQQGAGKASEGSSRNEGNEVQSAQPRPETSAEAEKRPTYVERREAQKTNWNPETKSYDSRITAGGLFCETDKTVFGQQSARPGERKYTCKHKLLFTACKPDAWVDGNVPTQFSRRKVMATRFKTRELADIAAREYQEDRGYAIESMRCDVCKCWHIVGKNFPPIAATEIDLTKEQREVRVTVEDALQQHAQA